MRLRLSLLGCLLGLLLLVDVHLEEGAENTVKKLAMVCIDFEKG